MSTTGQPLNFANGLPAAPAGDVNVVFQADAPTAPPTSVVRNVSAYMPPMTAIVGGAVPTPPNDSTKFLNGQGNWRVPAGGGGGSNDDISFYLTPTTVTPPTLSTWAYRVNAVIGSNGNGAMVLTTKSGALGLEVLGQSISAGDFDLVACFALCPAFAGGKLTACALVLWDSGSGKVITFQLNLTAGTVPGIYVAHYASFTASATVVANENLYFTASPFWMRINFSYGKYSFLLSVDGQSWDLLYQESYTAYLPVEATNVGVGCYNNQTTPANLVIPHYAFDNYVGS
jgi:hypothetical protein